MSGKLIITFPTTETQKELLLEFCKDKINGDYVISLKQTLPGNIMLSLSMFKNRPEIYIGILDLENKRIITDRQLSDDQIIFALRGLERKYDWATTRTSPVANVELVTAWIDYMNSGHVGTRITINEN